MMIKNKIKQCFIFFILSCWILTSCSLPESEDALDKAPDSIQAAEDSLKGAIIYGHHDLVKEAVEEGADINQFLRPARWESEKFATPLSLAIQESPSYMVKYLLEMGADINSLRTDYYNPAIYWINLSGKKADDYFSYLIENQIDLTEKNADGNTALDCIFMDPSVYDKYDWNKVKILIENGVSINQNTIDNAMDYDYENVNLPQLVRMIKENGDDTGIKKILESALLSDNEYVIEHLSERLNENEMEKLIYFSAAYCNRNTLDEVIKKGKNYKYSLTQLLRGAARTGNLENVKYLVEELKAEDAWENEEFYTSAMEQAEANGHYDVVDYMIANGFEIPNQSWSTGEGCLLTATIIHGDLERLQQLINIEGTIPDDFNILLNIAGDENNREMFEWLYNYAIEHSIEMSENGIIYNLILNGREDAYDIIQYILEKEQINVQERNKSLRCAIDCADVRAVKLLLEAGADPNALDIPSHAVYDDNLEIIKLLVEYGLDVNHEGLVESSAMYSNGVMTYLINQGADISADGPNSHALFYAVNKGRIQNAKTLLDAGIDTTIKNKDGNTAYDMALMGGIDEMIALFEEKQQNIEHKEN